MNEEIKKIEISEDELEDVSGGAGIIGPVICPICQGEMVGAAGPQGKEGNYPRFVCLACKYVL